MYKFTYDNIKSAMKNSNKIYYNDNLVIEILRYKDRFPYGIKYGGKVITKPEECKFELDIIIKSWVGMNIKRLKSVDDKLHIIY